MRARALFLLLATAEPGFAQQLAVQTFSVREGLAHSRVNCLFEDRRGYLWLGTWEGLSRFDGHRFVNFGTADGLPNPFITCVAEDRDGALWVGTLGNGIARLCERRRDDGSAFESWSVAATPFANDVANLVFDAAGRLWITTSAGIYRAVRGDAGLAIDSMLERPKNDFVTALDGDGSAIVFGSGLVAMPQGDELAPVAKPATGLGEVVAVLPHDGGFLVACEHGLSQIAPPFATTAPVAVEAPLRADERVKALAMGRRGSLWVATTTGLLERRGNTWQRFDVRHGLPDDVVLCLFVDREDGLWIGTHQGGVAYLSDRSATTFAARQGFADCNVSRVVAASGGRMFAATRTGGQYEVLPDRVVRLPEPAGSGFATAHRRVHCDRRGDFWIGTDDGLWHCPGPHLDAARCRHLGADDGLPTTNVCAEVQEVADGRLWLSTSDGELFVRERDGTKWQRFVSMRQLGDVSPCRLVVDWRDRLALASFDHLWRADGASWSRVQFGIDGALRPRCVHRDRDGSMWVGTRFLGAFAERPSGELLHLDAHSGLASDAVWSIAEDGRGRLYFGTARGISSYDKDDGRVRPFGGELLREPVTDLYCAAGQVLWAATAQGLLRFDLAAPAAEHTPPRTYVADVRVDGERLPLPVNGALAVRDLVLAPGQRNLEVEFVGVGPLRDGSLRFQHRLLGVDADWSPPSEVPQLRFANLAAGDYRVGVRAVDAAGAISSDAAELAFTVLPAVWQRPWFLAVAAAIGVTLAFAWHRLHLRRAVATERLRTQIATDLHDDVGAGLAQIAILSEVARRSPDAGRAAELGEIAQLARTLRAAMGDIVWALARGHDSLADMVPRMRQLCTRLLEVDGVEIAFATPPAERLAAVRLSLEQRRQCWLWFREAVTNVALHARARRVDVALALSPTSMQLTVRDDGVGFAPASIHRGNGLTNLQHRGERLGGRMQLDSSPGAGTLLSLEVPLGRRPRPDRR